MFLPSSSPGVFSTVLRSGVCSLKPYNNFECVSASLSERSVLSFALKKKCNSGKSTDNWIWFASMFPQLWAFRWS